MKGETEARRRIGLLDGAPPGATITPLKPRDDLIRVIQLMGTIANTHGPDVPVGDPAALDDIIQSCQLLHRITTSAPALTSGGLDHRQLWTGSLAAVSAPRHISGPPTAENFQVLTKSEKPRIKPTREGLYTSTLLPGSQVTSMWLIHLEYFGGALFPKPRRTYELIVSPDARVCEVSSAQAWAALVKRYPLRFGGLVYPDWPRMAAAYDAVHFSLPAVVAMQEIRLAVEDSVIAEGYWDVEQTFWLNWSFTDVRPIQD